MKKVVVDLMERKKVVVGLDLTLALDQEVGLVLTMKKADQIVAVQNQVEAGVIVLVQEKRKRKKSSMLLIQMKKQSQLASLI